MYFSLYNTQPKPVHVHVHVPTSHQLTTQPNHLQSPPSLGLIFVGYKKNIYFGEDFILITPLSWYFL